MIERSWQRMKYIHKRIDKLKFKKDLTQTLNQIQIKSTPFPFKMHQIHPNQIKSTTLLTL